jgi:hypothetical protein
MGTSQKLSSYPARLKFPSGEAETYNKKTVRCVAIKVKKKIYLSETIRLYKYSPFQKRKYHMMINLPELIFRFQSKLIKLKFRSLIFYLYTTVYIKKFAYIITLYIFYNQYKI